MNQNSRSPQRHALEPTGCEPSGRDPADEQDDAAPEGLEPLGASAPRADRRRGFLLGVFGLLAALFAGPASARPRKRPGPAKRGPAVKGGARVRLEVRVIEAKQGSKLSIDPKLKALARDLKSLPFREYHLIDHHKKNMVAGERMSFQFPGPGKKNERFLVVDSRGERRGKLAFVLSIDALKFRTKVAVPNGGTIVVGGPRSRRGNIIFAVTAHRD